jgi:hypothetical protein
MEVHGHIRAEFNRGRAILLRGSVRDVIRVGTVLLAQCETEPCIGATPRAVEVWLEASL